MWSGSIANIPSGWLLCNGSSGTPDLRDRFIVGAGSTYAPGNTGGFATYSLSTAQLPSHTHTGTTATVDINHTHSGSTGFMSANNTHSHGISDPGHDHCLSSDCRIFDLNNASGPGNNGAGGFSGGQNVVAVQSTQTKTTGITGTNTVDINHVHSFTSGGMNSNNIHSHTFTTAATGSGASIDNRPPYYALAYIMKV
jgi:microcystin-dependent protein